MTTTQHVLLLINAVFCAGIALRLLLYRRDGAAHHAWVSWLAYGLIVCTGSVALRIALGVYAWPVDWAEVSINGVLCAAVFVVRGNLACLFRIRHLMTPRRYKWKY